MRRWMATALSTCVLLAFALPASAETFEWDTVGSPSEFSQPRFFTAGAANPAGTQAVIYGGKPDGPPDPGVPYADTWTYEGGDWIPRCGTTISGADSACGPGPSFFHGAGTGPGGVVMFGAGTTTAAQGTTWLWNGASWEVLCDQTGCPPGNGDPQPAGRFAMAMAGNGAHVLMYGGLGTGPSGASDTWLFDGTGWTEICAGCAPGALHANGMAWDGTQFVMFGGGTGPGQPMQANTWTFTPGDSDWQLACGPSDCGPAARGFAALATVASSNPGVLMLAGNADPGGGGDSLESDFWFWEASTDSWSSVDPGPWVSTDGICGIPVFATGGLEGGAVAGIGMAGSTFGVVGAPDLTDPVSTLCPAGEDPGENPEDPGGGPDPGDPRDPGDPTDPGSGDPGSPTGPNDPGNGSGAPGTGSATLPATGAADLWITLATALLALGLGLLLAVGSRRHPTPSLSQEQTQRTR
ncbi:MAG: hypothetical protein M5U31_12510 [Acidimicrobiia bacterium]|nr:hypothetical protein [Acidimicrobiia bacterium]